MKTSILLAIVMIIGTIGSIANAKTFKINSKDDERLYVTYDINEIKWTHIGALESSLYLSGPEGWLKAEIKDGSSEEEIKSLTRKICYSKCETKKDTFAHYTRVLTKDNRGVGLIIITFPRGWGNYYSVFSAYVEKPDDYASTAKKNRIRTLFSNAGKIAEVAKFSNPQNLEYPSIRQSILGHPNLNVEYNSALDRYNSWEYDDGDVHLKSRRYKWDSAYLSVYSKKKGFKSQEIWSSYSSPSSKILRQHDIGEEGKVLITQEKTEFKVVVMHVTQDIIILAQARINYARFEEQGSYIPKSRVAYESCLRFIEMIKQSKLVKVEPPPEEQKDDEGELIWQALDELAEEYGDME